LTPEQAAAARPTLRQGMGPGDPAVVFVQRYLRVTPDSGYFGTLTRAAVTAYQKSLGISATGTVGPLTWAAIAAGRTAPAPTGTTPSPTPTSSPPTAPGTFTPPAGATPREVAVAFALAQVGKPYVLGGNGPEVFDCSGLVQQAYLAAGVKLPRLASQQRFAGTRVDLDELLPGDLLYYQDGSSPRNGHISMYAGDGRAVEAANPRRGVRVRDLNETWYRDRFVAAVRIG
jgi:cell wall-associated NlpC family hydrolase